MAPTTPLAMVPLRLVPLDSAYLFVPQVPLAGVAMTDLRAAVVEAMAISALRRVYADRTDDELREWVHEDHPYGNDLIPCAEAHLDGLLDTLAARADEWMNAAWDIAMKQNPPHKDHEANLIAVLRGDE